MRLRRLSPLAVVCLAMAGGCATIAHGSRQTVTVTSDPPGATVTVLSTPPGLPPVVRSTPGPTPIQLELTRRDPDITLRFESAGCPPVEVHVRRTTSGWIAANLLFANPLSMQGMSNPAAGYTIQLVTMIPLTMGIDVLSGAAYKLPKVVHAPLCRQ